MSEHEKIFKYKLDFYYQSALIYLVTLILYGSVRGSLVEGRAGGQCGTRRGGAHEREDGIDAVVEEMRPDPRLQRLEAPLANLGGHLRECRLTLG